MTAFVTKRLGVLKADADRIAGRILKEDSGPLW